MDFFGDEHKFNSTEELEDFIETEHADNPDCLQEVGEITDEAGNLYGFSWKATLEKF